MGGEFDEVYDVELPESMSAADMHLVVSVRPEAVRTLATLYAWRLTDFKKIVVLANNVMAVRNPDDLFLQVRTVERIKLYYNLKLLLTFE